MAVAILTIENGQGVFLIDCGFPLKQTEERLLRLGMSGGDIDAILVTHEHADHVGGVAPLAHKYALPVYASHGTLQSMRRSRNELGGATAFDGDGRFTIEGITVNPVRVPHDAREPTQFVLSDASTRVGVLSDLGSVTQHVLREFERCDYLLLEANHDRELLMTGTYPPRLKRRVGVVVVTAVGV